MKNKTFLRITALLLLVSSLTIMGASCMTNRHTIGEGAQTGVTRTSRQWYALWGLIKLGNTDTKEMVDDANNYEIETYFGVADWFINLFLGFFTIRSRTVKVIK